MCDSHARRRASVLSVWRKPLVSVFTLGLLVAPTWPNMSVANEPVERPNVVLVMADDMGWGQTGYRNHPVLKTPHLDEMSENGIRFDRFYAGAPVCSPTRASVLTGRSNDRTGVLSHGYALRRQEATLAQHLKSAGYVTGHFGKWHLNGLRGPGVPVLSTDSHHPGHFGFDQWLSVTNFFDRDPVLSRRGKFEAFAGDSSEIIVDEALDFITRQANQEQPFFAVIWYGTPHNPFRADDIDMEPFADLDEESKNHYGELVAMDRSVGTLRAGLRKLKVADNTLLWFCSDNGGLGEVKPSSTGGLRGHKGQVYEGGLMVPAILEWPNKVKTPHVTEHRSCTMDILPTILDVLDMQNVTRSVPRDGVTLMPMIDSLVSDAPLMPRSTPIFFRHEGKLAVIDGDMKLLTTDIRKRKFELYDLKSDPNETSDLSRERPEIVERLIKVMVDWNRDVQNSIAGKDYPEGKILPGEPERRFWTTLPEYKTFFDEWENRPEYSRWIKKARANP
ncbi:MAG: sulfatase-like hydrolase/transferase [Planctomycetota bacterium]